MEYIAIYSVPKMRLFKKQKISGDFVSLLTWFYRDFPKSYSRTALVYDGKTKPVYEKYVFLKFLRGDITNIPGGTYLNMRCLSEPECARKLSGPVYRGLLFVFYYSVRYKPTIRIRCVIDPEKSIVLLYKPMRGEYLTLKYRPKIRLDFEKLRGLTRPNEIVNYLNRLI